MQLAFEPGGQRLLTRDSAGTVKVWDRMEERLLFSLGDATNRVLAAAFSPTNGQLATCTADGQVQLWDWVGRGVPAEPDIGESRNGSPGTVRPTYLLKQVLKLAERQLTISTLVFSPDGRWLAGADGGQTVRVWDAANGADFMTLTNCPAPVIGLAFGSQGDTLVIRSASTYSPQLKGWSQWIWGNRIKLDEDFCLIGFPSPGG